MSDLLIRAALETRLAALTPALATAWENASYSPVDGVPFQRVEYITAEPENPEMGSFRRLSGFMQVTLMYPQGSGPAVAATRAELIRSWFPKGLSLTKSGVVVMIDRTPYIMAGFRDENRWALPVRVSYFSNISS
jgi:hypothetical protein